MNKPIQNEAAVVRRRDLKNGYHSLIFEPFAPSRAPRPGQFLHIKLPGSTVYFRRAFSVASIPEPGRVEIIIKVFGRGSGLLSRMRHGDKVDILGPLGNCFRLPPKTATSLIVAGGVGFPPLLYLADHMVKSGIVAESIHFFYGGRSSGDIIERSRIKKQGVKFHPVTEDGSFGQKGLVTEVVSNLVKQNPKAKYRLYGCGPEGMLKAVDELGRSLAIKGQISMEAPMPCGIGVCLGCVVPLVDGGHARVCHDGPIFEIGEVAL